MPERVKVYDKKDHVVLEMWEVDAVEAVKNDTRYSLTKPSGWGAPPPPTRGSFGKGQQAKAAAAEAEKPAPAPTGLTPHEPEKLKP
jgi:hypothetical protein